MVFEGGFTNFRALDKIDFRAGGILITTYIRIKGHFLLKYRRGGPFTCIIITDCKFSNISEKLLDLCTMECIVEHLTYPKN